MARGLLTRIATHDTALFRNLRLYIHWRKPERLLRLFGRYGFNLSVGIEKDLSSLDSDIAKGCYGPCISSPWGLP